MRTKIIKIDNIEHLKGEIDIFKNSGYMICKADKADMKVIFSERNYYKQQKTLYFKTN